VRLVLATYSDVPVILKEAIVGKDHQVSVFVIENNSAVAKKITLGIRQDKYVQVVDGLRQGEKVVIMGKERLSAGSPVIMEE
jgi:multidrug efflux pump subunit AcrA (membrane-fusion protein)